MVSLGPLVVGLTGGIGSGKTTVAKLFAQKKIDIIDADELAREVVVINSEGYQHIVEHFGPTILDNNQQINRALLKEKIFPNPQERQWLEKLLHPLILTLMRKKIETATSPYCIAVIPLLLEAHQEKSVDRILVVDVDQETQITRVQQRDGLSLEQITAILETQISRQKRLDTADDVIANTGDPRALKTEVEKLHQIYLSLALKRK